MSVSLYLKMRGGLTMEFKLTQEQMAFDDQWKKCMENIREKGFLIHEHDGVALISTHKLQKMTRSEEEYVCGQLSNGGCLKKLGYKDCKCEKCLK